MMPRLSERSLFILWQNRQTLKAKIARANKRAIEMDRKIIGEMERRGLKLIQDAETGEHVTLVTPEVTVTDQEKLRTLLRRSPKGRAVLERCTIEVLDLKAIASEVQVGNIPPRVVAECSEIKPSAVYLRGGRS